MYFRHIFHESLPLPLRCRTHRAESILGRITEVARGLLFLPQHPYVIMDLSNVVRLPSVVAASRHMPEEAFGTAVRAAPAVHWSVEARSCDDVDVRLHSTKSDREAVMNKTLLLFREWYILVVEAVSSLHCAFAVSVTTLIVSGMVYRCSGGCFRSPLRL